MKLVVLFIISLGTLTAFAADTFTCEVSQKTVVTGSCTICESYNGDRDCLKEIFTTCLVEKTFVTEVQDVKLHPSVPFILGGKNDTFSFIFSISPSGYNAALRSDVLGVQTSTQSSKPLDPWLDSVQISARTNQAADKVGAITELILNCKPL